MITKAALLLLVVIAFTGCQSDFFLPSVERFTSQHYILRQEQGIPLEGPHKFKKVVSANQIVIERNKQDVTVTLLGCRPTGVKDFDDEAMLRLGRIWPDDVYLRKDSTSVLSKNALKAVVYDPAEKVEWRNEAGKTESDVVNYTMPQLLNLLDGYCLFDNSDTNYPLNGVFMAAEGLAKKHRKGYWGGAY